MKVLRPNFEKRGGLVTVVVQDHETKRVLMVAYTNEAGYLETLATGNAVYWSTSRSKRWCKGETSGDFQKVRGVFIDCDGDALIYSVTQVGDGACHTKAESCFYRSIAKDGMIMNAPEAGEKEELPLIEAQVDKSVSDLFKKRDLE